MTPGDSLRGRTVLVTGADGFIGQHVQRMLSRVGAEVVALVRRPVAPAGTDPSVRRICVPALEPHIIIAALADLKFELAINLAASGVNPADRDPVAIAQVNTVLPVVLASQVLKHGGGLVSIGSSAEYCSTLGSSPRSEIDPIECHRLYGASKAAGGNLARVSAAASSVNSCHLRLFNVFGPGEAAHRLFPHLVDRLSRGQPASLSPGLQVRDFVPIDEAVRAIMLASDHVTNGGLGGTQTVFNIASGRGVTVRRFCQMVAEAIGADHGLLQFGSQALRSDDLPVLIGNPDQAAAELGFRINSSLEEAIERLAKAQLQSTQPTAL